jgi:glycosyltransferase involved in cell wall biosynthesis
MITFNHEAYIREAIEGVLLQKCNFPIELIIGEDCSDDNTKQICHEYALKNSLIKLLPSESNLGMMPNFIRSLKACTGKFIAICEGDDYWTDPYKLQKQVDELETNKEACFCFTAMEMLEDYNTKRIVRPDFIKPIFTVEDFILNQTMISTATFVFRNIGRTPDWIGKLMAGDKFIIYYFTSIGMSIYLDTTTAVYRVHKNGVHSKLNNSEKVNTIIHDFKIIDKALNYKYHSFFKQSLEMSSHFIYDTLHQNISAGQYSKARRDLIIWSKIKPVRKIIFRIKAKNLVKILLGTTLYMSLFRFKKFFRNEMQSL